MTETLLAALIGAGTTMVVQMVTIYISRLKATIEIRQKNFQTKREKLSNVYKTLISVINSFPNESPNDVLKYLEYAPGYSHENFNVVLKSLDYQIEDYKNQLKKTNNSYEQINYIQEQILNREYSKKRIIEIRDKYYKARKNFQSFYDSDKMIFDLYAGQDVRNALISLEVVIHNVFISGDSVGDVYNPLNNIIEISRRKLIDEMRDDLGIN